MAAGPARADDGGGDDRRRSWWHGDHGSLRELLVHVGAFAALASVAWIVGHLAEQRKRRKTLILALTSPNCRNREEETVPDYAEVPGSPSHLYHSGQAKLFSEKLQAQTQKSSQVINEIYVHPVPRLSDYLPDIEYYDNRFFRTRTGTNSRRGYCVAVSDGQVVLSDLVRTQEHSRGTAFVRAGPRSEIVFRPTEVVACIVTCGGLCPGLNDVIHELVEMLHYNYSVDTVYGIRFGYRGFYDPDFLPYLRLTPAVTQAFHKTGGTMLGSSRGGFDLDKILNAIKEHDISQIYIIGGDGTHRGATAIYDEVRRRKLKISVVCIPKTIDNDIGIIDRSFGFNTAVEEAQKAIASARVEAACVPKGIGLVKLMGRYAGFIAAHATLASQEVDLCLIAEIPIQLEGDQGILSHIKRAIEKNGHCTIVLAEGAGGNLLQKSDVRDASGNYIPEDIGVYLKKVLKDHFRSIGTEVSIKYNDPSYMIRSVPANASDAIYCMILAQNAVHGAMAGYTGFTSGLVNNRTVLLPINLVTESSPTFLNPNGHTWERVVRTTHQPFVTSITPVPTSV
ncbi:Phosphofructokinase domain-containing protein [Plasmodiophora brassicae]